MCDRCRAIEFEFASLRSTKAEITDPIACAFLTDDIERLTGEKEALQAVHREASLSMLDFHLEAASSYCEELELKDAEHLIECVQQTVLSTRK